MESSTLTKYDDLTVHDDTNSVDSAVSGNLDPMTESYNASFATENKRFMTLTPVKLKELGSPIQAQSQNLLFDCEKPSLPFTPQLTQESPKQIAYRENFSAISKELFKLLENLNYIYGRIGYSNVEIVRKEKQIFTTFSNSIQAFFKEADEEMNYIMESNASQENLLNKILTVIDDPSGIRTIPDLYIRNAILISSSKTVPLSPKKSLSLLRKQHLLETARTFILKSYTPIILRSLRHYILLQQLTTAIDDNRMDPSHVEIESRILSTLPPVDLSLKLLRQIETLQNDHGKLSQYISDNSKTLLESPSFAHLSTEVQDCIESMIGRYQKEYDSRISFVNDQISNLKKLKGQLSDIPLFSKLTYIQEYSSAPSDKFLPVHKPFLEKLEADVRELEILKDERKRLKTAIVHECQILWRKLRIPNEYIEQFMLSNDDLTEKTIQTFQMEINRLESMKKVMINNLINKCWSEIEELWKVLHFPEDLKQEFVLSIQEMKSVSKTLEDEEQILSRCEEAIDQLKERKAIYEPILVLTEEFKSLQIDKQFLEESSKDSSRLLTRNSHKILLKEEQIRKRITRHFPRVIEDLSSKLEDLEQKFGAPFYYEGMLLKDIIEEEVRDLQMKYPRSRIRLTKSSKQSYHTNSLMSTKVKSTRPVKRTSSMPIANTETSYSNDKSSGCVMKNRPTKDRVRSLDSSNLTTTSRANNRNQNVQAIKDKSGGICVKGSQLPTINLDMISTPIQSMKKNLKKELLPVSKNILNSNSRIPRFEGMKLRPPHNLHSNSDKENFMSNSLAPNSPESKVHTSVKRIESSPYKESDQSDHKLIMSPEGRYQSSVRQNAYDDFDDTSIMDEDQDKDYTAWKQAQVSRLNEK